MIITKYNTMNIPNCNVTVGGSFTGIWALSMAVVAQVLLMITEYWVRWWAGSTFYPERDVTNVWILGILTVLCIFIGFYRAIAWFEFTLAASSNLHERSLWAVLHAPLQFFVANPSGTPSYTHFLFCFFLLTYWYILTHAVTFTFKLIYINAYVCTYLNEYITSSRHAACIAQSPSIENLIVCYVP